MHLMSILKMPLQYLVTVCIMLQYLEILTHDQAKTVAMVTREIKRSSVITFRVDNKPTQSCIPHFVLLSLS